MRRLCVVAIGAVLMALPSSGAARSDSATRNGLIAFSAFSGSTIQIFTVEPNGRGLRQLTRMANLDGNGPDPTWSPNGKNIVFVRMLDPRSANSELYSMRTDGSNIRRLTRHAGADQDPAWSPDGRRVAFARQTQTGIAIATMYPDGSHVHVLLGDGYNTNPAWSPDGRRIVFARDCVPCAAYVINADGTGLRRLVAGDSNDETDPEWSPDGSLISFLQHHWCGGNCDVPTLETVAPDGSNQNTIVDPNARRFQPPPGLEPRWAPNGAALVAIGGPAGQEGELTIFKPDGTFIRSMRPVTTEIFDVAWQPAPR
jgi:Tol biopolymer transport system component